jgi:hypothetical protein
MTRRQEPDPITVLMPCKSQKKEFFFDAVRSIVRQTSPCWRLLIVTDPTTPPEIEKWAGTFADRRISVLMCPHTGFARALNHGLQAASTQFVSILLSDDRYAARAIAALMAYRQRYPAADFFHSARRHISEAGQRWGGIIPSRREFQLRDFSTRGSPVKHLLCWRRAKSIEIGGMDESLSVHGCDDYDFPWRMAEAGARFQAVRACLYEYRLHHAHHRLTTCVPLESQMATLRAIFSRHNIAPLEADRFMERAARGYLVPEFLDQIDRQRGAQSFVRCFRETRPEPPPNSSPQAVAKNSAVSNRLYVVPAQAPDVPRFVARGDSRCTTQFLLYTRRPAPAAQEVPAPEAPAPIDLAAPAVRANATIKNSIVRCGLLHFGGALAETASGPNRALHLAGLRSLSCELLNGIVADAAENRFAAVYWPAEAAAREIDGNRYSLDPDSYGEVCHAAAHNLGAERVGNWWHISLPRDAPRLGATLKRWERGFEVDAWPKMVCVLHEAPRTSRTVDAFPVGEAEAAARAAPARDANAGGLRCRWEAVPATFAQGPCLERGIVKIPVHWDQSVAGYAALPRHQWMTELHALMAAREFVVIRLNRASEQYAGILADLTRRAILISPDEVANRVALGHSRWFEAAE